MFHTSSLGISALEVKAPMPRSFCDDAAMQEESAGSALSENLKALMKADKQLTSDAKVAKKAGIDQKTVWRMVNEANSASIKSVSRVAAAFGLSAWQILVPGLDPNNLPVVTMTEAERAFYARLKTDITTLVTKGTDGER